MIKTISAILSLCLLSVFGHFIQAQKPDLQGHRGARGLLPENTIPSMLNALDMGASTLELDVVISADLQVVVSHEPWMNHEIATPPSGNDMTKEDKAGTNLYHMTYSEIKKWDVGQKGHPGFPQQQPLAAHKPLLAQLIDSVEAYVQERQLPPPHYNIEIKSTEQGDDLFHPQPEIFVELVMTVVFEKQIQNRSNIQSFDVRPLQILRKRHPQIPLAFLTSKPDNMEQQLKELGFTPEIYSPYYKATTADLIRKAQGKGMKVIPWTVNDLPAMQRLLEAGADGIISDYPNLFQQLNALALPPWSN